MKEISSIRSLTLVYNESEDRLMIVACSKAGNKHDLLLTRALTGRLVNGLAAVLEKSSMAAVRAPADIRGDLVLLEHQGAISPSRVEHPAQDASPFPQKSPHAAKPHASQQLTHSPTLVTSIDIATYPTHFRVVMKAGNEAIAGFDTNRVELHRLLDLLIRKSQEADWRLSIKTEWLDLERSATAMN